MENITVDWQYEYIVHAYFSKGGLAVRVSAPDKLVSRPGLGGGVLPYMGYVYRYVWPKGYVYNDFSAVLVTKRVLISAYFGHFGHGFVLALI